MQPESSLLYSQDLTTGLYPDPDESGPNLPSYLSKIHSNVTFSCILNSSAWYLPFIFPD